VQDSRQCLAFALRVMHQAPAAACLSLRPPSSSVPSLAELIGETMLLASAAIAQALHERGNGGLTVRTKRAAEDLIVQLYALQRACTSEGVNFDVLARSHGKRAIVRRYAELRHLPDAPDVELTDAVINEMLGWPLNFLSKVVRARMH
jgi:hypothetical protein